MRYTISIACYNRADMTQECIRCVKRNINLEETEIIFSDNASTDDTIVFLATLELPHKKTIRYGVNTGFGPAHNKALLEAQGEYFIVLNNDVFIQEPNWLDKLIEPLSDPEVALVGFDGVPATLRPDGNGHIGKLKEYVEGACLAGRTKTFLEYGLFSPAIWKYYFEDSDLSLRMRQAGFKLAFVPIKHIHQRGATAKTMSDPQRPEIIKHNSHIFHGRWSTYLSNKQFTNEILVRMISLGAGDILAMTPVLEGLRYDHPTASIELDTSHPYIFENNPNVSTVSGGKRRRRKAYDRVVDIRPDYKSKELISRQAERIACTTVLSQRPQLFLTKQELAEGAEIIKPLREEYEAVIALNLLMSRKEWEGRNWSLVQATELIETLNDEGIGTIEIGKDVQSTGKALLECIGNLTVRQLFAVIAQSDMFIGIDSFPFHIAQAFGKPSFVMFGATEPISRVVDFTTTWPIRQEGLDCLGCYHRYDAAPINKCALGTERCMKNLSADMVLEYLFNDVNPLEKSISYLQTLLRRDNCAM